VWDLGREAGPVALRHTGAGIVRGVAFAPDSKTVFTAGWTAPPGKAHGRTGRASLRLWDPATGKLARELAMPEIEPNAVAASPDGRRVAVAGYSDSPLRLWDLGRGHERGLWAAPGSVFAAAFSPDGRVLAAGGDDPQPCLFEAETGKEVLRLGRHERWVSAVAFAPGGRVLATADGGWYGPPGRGEGPLTVRFWDVATGRELSRLGGHASAVTSLAFNPDGTCLVAGLSNGTALVWAVPPEARPADRGAKLARKELEALWADLAGNDARKAYAAVWMLAASPDQSVPFLADALRPAGKPDAAKVRQRIADLGDDDFAVREKASRELALWGEDVEPELRAALAGQPSPEAVRRIERLLAALIVSPPPERCRELRGVWVLELIGTPGAEQVLTGLAKGDPDARLTREAKVVLGRR
jgi:WD40 repeat protein